MTALLPEQAATLDELASAIGLTPRRIPRWIRDPALIKSYLAGHIDIDDDFNPQEARDA